MTVLSEMVPFPVRAIWLYLSGLRPLAPAGKGRALPGRNRTQGKCQEHLFLLTASAGLRSISVLRRGGLSSRDPGSRSQWHSFHLAIPETLRCSLSSQGRGLVIQSTSTTFFLGARLFSRGLPSTWTICDNPIAGLAIVPVAGPRTTGKLF